MHLVILGVLTVLGGTRRCNNRCVHDSALLEYQSGVSQMLVHRVEYRLSQPVSFQEMAEIENCGFVGKTIGQTQARKSAHGLDFVQRVLHGGIAQIVEQLKAVNPQHGRQRIGWPACFAFVVVSTDPLLDSIPYKTHTIKPRCTLPH